MNRRDFLKRLGLAAAGVALAPSVAALLPKPSPISTATIVLPTSPRYHMLNLVFDYDEPEALALVETITMRINGKVIRRMTHEQMMDLNILGSPGQGVAFRFYE